jgi:TRAP-type mannitol/chloroaromatic compound transport system permease large subunit
MIALLIANMAPIMFVSLIVFLLLGYPVSFSLAALGLFYGVVGIWLGLFEPNFLQALPQRVFGVMANETLLAVPYFTFMGLILERSGMAEKLLDTVGRLFGSLRGGLAYAVIFVGALLAATTGVVAASVIAMGLISLPIMLRYGYDRRLAAGTIAASGTLAQIIPPSLVLIIMAEQLGKPVGDMYLGAVVPGIMLAGFYALYVLGMTIFRPAAAPALPPEARSFGDGADYASVMRAVALPLLLMVWAMVILFVPAIGFAIYDQVVPFLAPVFALAGGSEVWSTLLKIGALVAIYFGYFLLVRNGPRGLAQAMGAALMVAAVWFLYQALVFAGAAASDIDFKAHTGFGSLLAMAYAALVSPLAQLGAALATVCAGATLWHSPRPPIAKAMMRVVADLLPPLILIFLVLGTIFRGIATPTEGGAMGAVGAMILALMNRKLTFDLTRQAAESTARLSAFVLFILIGARVFSLTFYGVDGHRWVEHLLTGLPGGQMGFLIVINALMFFLAFFLDFFELAFIAVPLLVLPAQALGIDLVWLGVLLGVNMQTSFMHPPFGFALFYLRSVAPARAYTDTVTGRTMEPVTSSQIYWGAVPYVIIQLIMVGLIIAFPGLVLPDKKVEPAGAPAEINIQVPDIEVPQLNLN